MKPKKTLRARVQEFLNSHPTGVTSTSVYESIKAPKQSVYTVLWQMRKNGEARHDKELGLYYPMASHTETKSAEVPPKETNAHTVPWPQYHILRTEHEELQGRCDELCSVIDGMDAIIRYLENKVENLIREQVL